jgi:HK97 family phage prohead protease
MSLEYRHISGDATELRATGEQGMTISGYAARFNSQSEDMGFREVIEPGAFTRSLKSRNEIKAFINHDTNLVIGSTRSGTLTLSEDDKGLADTVSLPDTSYARDLSVSAARGDTSGQSFGFSVVRDEWNKDYTQRRLLEVRLHEVSIVTGFPAYAATTVNVRALQRLAYRTGMTDIDALADAMSALESGAELNDDQAAVLMETIDRSRPAREEAAPEPDLTALQALSELLKQRDDL